MSTDRNAGPATSSDLIDGFNDAMLALRAVLDVASVAANNDACNHGQGAAVLCDGSLHAALYHCRGLAETADGFAQAMHEALVDARKAP